MKEVNFFKKIWQPTWVTIESDPKQCLHHWSNFISNKPLLHTDDLGNYMVKLTLRIMVRLSDVWNVFVINNRKVNVHIKGRSSFYFILCQNIKDWCAPVISLTSIHSYKVFLFKDESMNVDYDFKWTVILVSIWLFDQTEECLLKTWFRTEMVDVLDWSKKANSIRRKYKRTTSSQPSTQSPMKQ